MSWRAALVVIACAVLVASGAGAALAMTFGLPWDRGGQAGAALTTPEPAAPPAWSSAGAVLPATGTGVPDGEPDDAPADDRLADVLAAPMSDADLGDGVGVSVVDLGTGERAYESGPGTPRTPASTLKILTATAALDVLGSGHRFTTRVVATDGTIDPAAARITLEGGGDPTLTAADDGASLAALADRTAAALEQAGADAVTLTYDDSLFTGPAEDPDWRPSYVPSDIVSPVTALAVDVAEERPGEPSEAAAEVFADLLGDRGIDVAAEPEAATTPADATELAAVRSAPVSTIVEDVLTTSDNDGAEVLARHVALGAGDDGTSAAASAAVTETLTDLGIDMSSATVLDGSGLARGSSVPAAAITSALALAADPDHPGLRAVLTGLPVAGFTGTLADRIEDAPAAGIVRAKTGTLTGVSALAGVVTSAGGGRYVFAVLADDVSNTLAARDALDDVAAAIASCGCGTAADAP